MRQPISDTTGQASTRLVIVDALRAVALLGIIVTHATMGFLVGPLPVPDFMSFSALDHVIAKWVPILVEGKFFTIFSFLFGLSFAIQLERAHRAGKPFAGRYAWRLLILMGIGFVHSMFFGGDILMIYALLGLLLLPVHRLRSRTLVITALILLLNLPVLVLGTLFLAAPAQTPEQQQDQTKQFERSALQQFEIKTKGTVRELVTLNLTEAVKNRVFFQLYTGRLWITYGLFLLGICAGRARLFESSEASTRFFVRLMVASGVAAAAATVFVIMHPVSSERTLRTVVSWYVGTIQHSLLAAFYVAAATLLLCKPAAAAVTRHLAPMGQTGLTSYLSQSVFGVSVFYGIGLGLLGELGVASSIGLAISFYVAQLFLARSWMTRFRFGPVEWLWRSLTDLRAHPMRHGEDRATFAS
jgi:uncharacterized protein